MNLSVDELTEMIKKRLFIELEASGRHVHLTKQAALRLFDGRFSGHFPYRSVGLNCSHLTPDDMPVQLDFTGDEERRMHMEQLERSIDDLRRRFGYTLTPCPAAEDGRPRLRLERAYTNE